MTDYTVVSAAAVIRDHDEVDRYYYGPPGPGRLGALVRGSNHPAARLRELADEGYLAVVHDAPVVDVLVVPEVPVKSASKADWVTYAVSQGMAETDAKKAKKDDLSAFYLEGTLIPVADPTAQLDAAGEHEEHEDTEDDAKDDESPDAAPQA